jgi:hypothetical protein
VAIARETLERALQLSYQLNLDLNSMTDWLNQLVSEIHKTEDSFVDNNPNSVEEIRFYEVIQMSFSKRLILLLAVKGKIDYLKEN